MGLRVPAVVADVHMIMEDGQPIFVIRWDLVLQFSKEMGIPTSDLGEFAEIVGIPPLDLMKNPNLLLHTAWIAEYDNTEEDWLLDYDEEH